MRNNALAVLTFVLFFQGLSLQGMARAAPIQTSSLALAIDARADLKGTITATLWTDTEQRKGLTLLCVHGLAHTAVDFQALAHLFLVSGYKNRPVRTVLSINLLGRAGSTLAPGSTTTVGALTLNDNVAVLLATLEALKLRDLNVDVLVGHSMGGMTVALAQSSLVETGNSLRRAFGISEALLLSPAIPQPLPWPFADSGEAAQIAAQYVAQDPNLGAVITFPPATFLQLFFSDLQGNVIASAPTEQTVVDQGMLSAEGFTAAAQMVRAPGTQSPQAVPGAFSPQHGTKVTIVDASQDSLLGARDEQGIAAYLTGKNDNNDSLVSVQNPDAVHDFFISNPELLVDTLNHRGVLVAQ